MEIQSESKNTTDDSLTQNMDLTELKKLVEILILKVKKLERVESSTLTDDPMFTDFAMAVTSRMEAIANGLNTAKQVDQNFNKSIALLNHVMSAIPRGTLKTVEVEKLNSKNKIVKHKEINFSYYNTVLMVRSSFVDFLHHALSYFVHEIESKEAEEDKKAKDRSYHTLLETMVPSFLEATGNPFEEIKFTVLLNLIAEDSKENESWVFDFTGDNPTCKEGTIENPSTTVSIIKEDFKLVTSRATIGVELASIDKIQVEGDLDNIIRLEMLRVLEKAESNIEESKEESQPESTQ